MGQLLRSHPKCAMLSHWEEVTLRRGKCVREGYCSSVAGEISLSSGWGVVLRLLDRNSQNAHHMPGMRMENANRGCVISAGQKEYWPPCLLGRYLLRTEVHRLSLTPVTNAMFLFLLLLHRPPPPPRFILLRLLLSIKKKSLFNRGGWVSLVISLDTLHPGLMLPNPAGRQGRHSAVLSPLLASLVLNSYFWGHWHLACGFPPQFISPVSNVNPG